MLGPETGNPADADPTHRWAVRLTQVQHHDYKCLPLVDPLYGHPITRIWWGTDDALPFPLCISSTIDADHGSLVLTDVSVALGNIIAADHGIWQDWEDLGVVPARPLAPVTQTSCSCGSQGSLPIPRPCYYPQLSKSPLTFKRAYVASGSATSFLGSSSSDTAPPTPQLCVRDDQNRDSGGAPRPLVQQRSADRMRGRNRERRYGFLAIRRWTIWRRPGEGRRISGAIRVGNGTAGNVGRDSLAHILTSVAGIATVTNPLAAPAESIPRPWNRSASRRPSRS